MRRELLFAGLTGALFGAGLLLSGLANPAKVLAFLDIAGAWDPSLLLVMGAAVGVGLVAFGLVKPGARSLLGTSISLPTRRDIDRRLVLGGLGFGVGWGLVGFCPGPALVALGTGAPKAIVFVLAMVAGMAVFEVLEKRRTP
ncbi:MAG TPA: DUF6691 family protein [Spongiibacteraceae bacterium]|jgi:uncharacterized membrane protein YedE/YeeE|nr:hypothetical protein [Spongiibacteraceae bacterium]HUH38816.1 DUF6691 family protein [Spongiibacteraceae bacterium]